MNGAPVLSEIVAALEPQGIFVRGALSFDERRGPPLADGGAARSVVLLGHVGGSIWKSFEHWRATHPGSDPLDTWSRVVIGPVADAVGATAIYPADQPWQPFQRWAMEAEGLKPSPLGVLIHPRYGLWHGYRGALAFAQDVSSSWMVRESHPCARCEDKPCLTACPASAVTANGFLVTPCRTYLATDEGRATCMIHGCASRNACPVGADFRYPAEQLRFLMAAL